jgi:predicted nucleic acid-binding protein
MRYLLDTGVLVRLLHRSDPLHSVVRDAIRIIRGKRHSFCTSTQNIAEFWNVCTRPSAARGGLGLDPDEVARRLRILERFITVLREPESAYVKWKSLVATHRVIGKQVHDARIAALMNAYRIRRIVTLNGADFRRYSAVVVAAPQDVTSGAFKA